MAAKNKPVSHILIPEHSKLSEKEKEDLFKLYNISIRELPKIFKNDPAIKDLGVKENDVIKIIRESSIFGSSVFYRGVINE